MTIIVLWQEELGYGRQTNSGVDKLGCKGREIEGNREGACKEIETQNGQFVMNARRNGEKTKEWHGAVFSKHQTCSGLCYHLV